MPELCVHRAEPFTRGDESVSIWIDGKALGTLPMVGPFVREISAGPHTVQAWMNGGTGKKISIHALEGDTINLTLSNTKMAGGSWWDAIILLLICAVPDEILSGKMLWIKIASFTALMAWSIYGWRKRKRDYLKLEITQMAGVSAV